MKLGVLKVCLGRPTDGDYEYVLWCRTTNEAWIVKRGKQ